MKEQANPITIKILNWYNNNKRELPWRATTEAYPIWLSEIIMQQTRIDQGLPYYQNFISTFPTVENLANATEEEVLKLWQGLGYYSRARNLHKTAQHVAFHLKSFPKSYNQLLQLKGVGEYTASAISSIVNNEAQAAIDGNALRVFARLYAIDTPVDTSKGRNIIKHLAQNIISEQNPGDFNQAIMDIGAQICKPKMPLCAHCPIADQCISLQNGKVELFPVKTKKIKKRKRYFYFLVIESEDFLFLEKRTKKDIWQNLFQFPLIEMNEKNKDLKQKDFSKLPFYVPFFTQVVKKSSIVKHILSHQEIYIQFYHLMQINEKKLPTSFIKIAKKNIFDFAVPKPIENYICEVLF